MNNSFEQKELKVKIGTKTSNGYKLTFNVLTFEHPKEEYTFWFTNQEIEELCRVHYTLVPDEVIAEFGEQEHYYTSFNTGHEGFLAITKKSKPQYKVEMKEGGEEKSVKVRNSAFATSMLKRYYNQQIHRYFKNKNQLVKPNFIDDTEIWLKARGKDNTYWYFVKITLKVQFGRITRHPELLVSFAGISQIFKQSVAVLLKEVPPVCFNWVAFNRNLYKYDDLPEEAKQNLTRVYPVWNFDIRDALKQETEAPDKTNKYQKFKTNIEKFFKCHLNTAEFKTIIPLVSESFVQVPETKINKVKDGSNRLLFANKQTDIAPFKGMKFGPFKTSDYTKIHFFYIFHKGDEDVARHLNKYFTYGLGSFPGLYAFTKVPYHTEKNFSIVFDNKLNPLPKIEEKILNRNFNPDVRFIAIYISPHSKNSRINGAKSVYYQVKELLLKKSITSQAVEAEKVRATIKKSKFDYSLNNMAIAMLAKLDGIPWQLDTNLKNELIVGIGAFKNSLTDVQYIGSAFSFMNDGRFKHFECFHRNQVDELAGAIMAKVKDYVSMNSHISRLIIHFFKNMSKKELEPIEKGLNNLGLDIPVFILSINKTESRDIVAFDNNWTGLMPVSGTFINIGYNRFLLFNNTRYNNNGSFNPWDGYPFPIKLSIKCTREELARDYKTIKELIDQVYQFSRMYWKSVRQQNLPVTIKYPEMVAEIYPHFEGNGIPTFGKDNLWFL